MNQLIIQNELHGKKKNLMQRNSEVKVIQRHHHPHPLQAFTVQHSRR